MNPASGLAHRKPRHSTNAMTQRERPCWSHCDSFKLIVRIQSHSTTASFFEHGGIKS